MAIIYRNITGPVSDAQGVLIPNGELIAKLLRPLIDSLTFISPEELRVPITDGLFTLVLAAPGMYDFQVIDQFGETWWNFQAPLDNDTPADISLAELYLLGTGYVEQDFDNPITTFLGLLDTPESYTGAEDYRVQVNPTGTGVDFLPASALSPVEYIDFELAPTIPVHQEGRMHWDALDKTVHIGLQNGSILQVGQEFHLLAVNKTGSTLPNGAVVVISGASGDRATIALADATDRILARSTIGVVTHETLNNAEGFVTIMGLVRDFDTSLWPDGSPVWLSSTTPGLLQGAPPPISPISTVFIGIVIRQHATEGMLFVKVICTDAMGELADVHVSGVLNGDHLAWNTANSRWENVQLSIGELYEDNDAGSDITMPLADTYYGWVTATEGTTEGITADVAGVDADSLSPDDTGRYEARVTASFSGEANTVITGCVHVNGTPQPNIKFDRKMGVTGDVGSTATSGVLSLTAGDLVDVRFQCDLANRTISIHRCNLLIHRV